MRGAAQMAVWTVVPMAVPSDFEYLALRDTKLVAL